MKIIIYTKEKIYNFKSISDKNYNIAIRHAHREDGPAYIKYFANGNIKYKKWVLNGKCHRENGPAIIWYNKKGKIKYESWHLNNKEYSKIKFDKEILKRKLKLVWGSDIAFQVENPSMFQ